MDGAEVMDYQIPQSIQMGKRKMKEADKSRERERELGYTRSLQPRRATNCVKQTLPTLAGLNLELKSETCDGKDKKKQQLKTSKSQEAGLEPIRRRDKN